MSFLAAALWSTSALLVLDLLARMIVSVRPSGQLDLVSGVLCQGVAFLGTLFFVMLLHDKERPLSDALGLRRTHVTLCLMALGIGLSLHGPLELVASAIYGRFPQSEEEIAVMRELLNAPTMRQKVALTIAAGLFGPVVEEVFFRGGIYRNLRRRHSAGLTLLGVSLLFAAAHLDVRNFLPDFLGGLAMGYVRILGGSLWPAILLHAGFNSGSVFVALRRGPEADMFSVSQSLGALVVTAVLLAVYGWVSMRSERCALARLEDTT